MTRQGELLPIAHRSRQPKRLRRSDHVSGERLFADAWAKWNRESNILGYVLTPDDQPSPVGYTRHDAATAASIVQWFGTNVGMAFVRDVLKQYDALVQEQRAVQAGRWWWRRAQNDALFRVPRHKILKAQVNAARERLKRLAQEMEKKR